MYDENISLQEPEFVGEGRRLLVDGLLAAYDEVNRTGSAQWMSLEAPSGLGKTRVVREFYSRLAAERQMAPAYWPPTILGSRPDRPDDVSSRRKQVYPKVEHVPGSLPSYFWWGIAASLRNGVASDALAEDLAQLKAHGPYLDDVWIKLAKWTEANPGWWRKPSGAAMEESVTHAAGLVIETLMGASLPGLGLVKPALSELRKASRTRAEGRARLAGHGDVAKSSFDEIDEAVLLLTRLARPGLPVVIFIEDFHAADAALAELVTRCVNSEAAILVITTAWPGHGEQHAHICDAFTATQKRRIRVDSETQNLPEPFPEGASLLPLDEAALASMVLHYYPLADADTLRRLTRRYGNPLALELFCTIERYHRRFPDGGLRLSDGEVKDLPKNIEDLYRSVWEELPATAREALVYASLSVPAILSPEEVTLDLHWHQPLLLDALAQMASADGDEIRDALSDSPPSAAWTRRLSKNLRGFHEQVQWQIARDDDEFLFAEDREVFLGVLADVVRRSLMPNEGVELDEHDSADMLYRARLSLMLHEKGKLASGTLAESVRAAQGALRDSPRELPTLVKLGEQSLPRLDSGSDLWCRVASMHATALDDSGRSDDAAAVFEEIIAIETRNHGAGAVDTHVARHNHARALWRAGGARKATELFQALIKDGASSRGPEDPDVLISRTNLAHVLSSDGRVDEAIELYESTWTAQKGVLGDTHPSSLVTQRGLADAYASRGLTDMALGLQYSALETLNLIYGEFHPETLVARHNLACFTAQMGCSEEAIAMLESLLIDSIEVLGEGHPGTTRTRESLFGTTVSAGRVKDALRIMEGANRFHGPAHAQALMFRRALCTLLDTENRWEEMVSLSKEAISCLGPDKPETLEWRQRLGIAYAAMGRAEDAVEQFTQTSSMLDCMVGSEDPIALQERHNLAVAIHNVGRVKEAIELLRAILETRERVLGVDHADTIKSRHNLAVVYEMADSEEAELQL